MCLVTTAISAAELMELYRKMRVLEGKVELYEEYFEIEDICLRDVEAAVKTATCPLCGEHYDNGAQHGIQIPGGYYDPPEYYCESEMEVEF